MLCLDTLSVSSSNVLTPSLSYVCWPIPIIPYVVFLLVFRDDQYPFFLGLMRNTSKRIGSGGPFSVAYTKYVR